MSSTWYAPKEQARPESDDETRRPSLAFVPRILLVLLLVAAFLFLFKRSTRLEPKLQAVLNAEERALTAGDWEAFAALLDPEHAPFWQAQRTHFTAVMSARRQGILYAGIPYPLHVEEVGRRDNLAWARVSGQDMSGSTVFRVEFFRQAYGRWLHTGPDPEWWGAEREQQSDHVVWRYREADETWIAGLVPRMEAAHMRVCSDLGLDPRRNTVTFDLCYSSECTFVPAYPTESIVVLPAPLVAGWTEQAMVEGLPRVLVGHLVARAADLTAGSVATESALMEGLSLWETEQVTGEPISANWLDNLRAAAASGEFLSFDEMTFPATPDTYALFYAQSYALVAYLVESSGPGVLPALARASSPSNSLDDALVEVLGPQTGLAAFEQGWRAWMQEQYGP